tara:strand:+ start:629 stop:1222 length:594 start_codon:yes stop_codon:yes gene_type:complete
MSVIVEIQKQLVAPKGQWNGHMNFAYRSAEDIVDAVKPLLHAQGLHLILSDEMVNLGDRYYVKATATVWDGDKFVSEATGYAREQQIKKGMDEAQITGAASSYARKYALNGLFAIDDGKDADSQDNTQQGQPKDAPRNQDSQDDDKPWFNEEDFENMRDAMEAKIKAGDRTGSEIVKNLRTSFKVNKKFAADIEGLE